MGRLLSWCGGIMPRLDVVRRAYEENIQVVLAAFGLVSVMLLAGCGGSGAPLHPVATRSPSGSSGSAQSPAENSTQAFPDDTKVTFVSATWVQAPDNLGPAVKFTFHIVAGPDWKQNAKVQLRPASGDEHPLNYYMVTASGWAYPASDSTGYADISNIVTAQGGQESGEGANTLFAGDSVYASSTLVQQHDSPNPQHLVVAIEMPNGKLQSRSFAMNVGPDPFGASPSADTGQPSTSPSAQPAGSPTTAPAPVITPGNDTPEDAVDGLMQAELAGDWTQACSYVVPSAQSACSQQASQLPAFTGNGTVVGGVISGHEALVEVTGSICGAGAGCTSNSDPSTGMPNSQETFAQAYSQALSNSNSSFSPVPCIEENGAWYVNYPQ